jgi:hypothetical protein
VGQTLAKVEVAVVLATLLSAFQVALAPEVSVLSCSGALSRPPILTAQGESCSEVDS